MLADCVFSLCQLWNGLLLGVIASLIATGMVITYERWQRKSELKAKYGKTEGEYLCFKTGDPDKEWDTEKDYTSKAFIKYKHDNILSIELSEITDSETPKFKWTGIITMDLENYGTIAWNYEIYEGKPYGGSRHEFGFKKIIITDIPEQGIYIYLIDDKYGKEVLEKQ